MRIEEMNQGKKIAHKLEGTMLSFGEGALCINLAAYQRDHAVTLDIMEDGNGNLMMGQPGVVYVAQVEIPVRQYQEIATMEETAPAEDGSIQTMERVPLPLNEQEIELRLWAVV